MNLDDVLLRSTCLSALGCAWQKVCRHDKKIRLLNFWMHLQQWQASLPLRGASARVTRVHQSSGILETKDTAWKKAWKKSMIQLQNASKCFKSFKSRTTTANNGRIVADRWSLSIWPGEHSKHYVVTEDFRASEGTRRISSDIIYKSVLRS